MAADLGNMSLADLQDYGSDPGRLSPEELTAWQAEMTYRHELINYGGLCVGRAYTGGDRPPDPPKKP